MKLKKFEKIFPILFLFVLLGCSSKPEQGGTLNIEVKTQMTKAWINLMPGTSAPRFHLMGEMEVKNNSYTIIEDLVIRKITVFQNGKTLFEFQPDFDLLNLSPNIEFSKGKVRLYAFKSKKGIKDFSNLNADKFISFNIEFSDGGKIYIKQVEDVKVDKVY